MTKYDKERTLQAILDNADVKIDVSDFDLTQPDDMDESGSGGIWDLAGITTQEIVAEMFGGDWFDIKGISEKRLYNARDKFQTLLYNLMSTYRCCDEEDEI